MNAYFVMASVGIFLSLFSCTGSQISTSKKDPILLVVGDKQIPISEFKYVYEKNITHRDSLYSRKSVEDYLNLFVNYKLKIAEADLLDLDTSENFVRELDSYKQILSKPYLVQQKRLDSLISEAYQRSKQEVKVAHILIKVAPEADPEDTLAAYKKINEARQKALSGADFGDLAREYSEDAATKDSQGNLGYFSALQMIYPFENAAYQTPPGSISEIVRSRYGYHLIKVLDKRTASGTVKVAHIMVLIPQNATQEQQKEYQQKIENIYTRLQNGEEWEKLCREFSDDSNSKNQGGELPPFKVGEVLPEFEEVAFKLNQIQEISRPIRTNYGWHIIKLLEKENVPTFGEAQSDLKKKIIKDSRYEAAEKALIQQLKKDYNFKEFPAIKSSALEKGDPRLLEASWSYNASDALNEQILFSLDHKVFGASQFAVKDFLNYVYLKQVPKTTFKNPKTAMNLYYEEFVKKSMLDYEMKNLPQKHQEYALLINEYREGMMLFQLMTEKVWEKAIKDTTGAKNYFKQHRDNYRWGQRVKATIYEVSDENTLNQLKNYLSKSYFPVANLSMDKIYFDKDSETLNSESVKTIKSIVEIMKKNPDYLVEVVGHADPSEKTQLAQQRIDPTVKYLTFEGIELGRIVTKDFGSTRPVSKDDRNKNRRVEFNLFTNDKTELEKLLNTGTSTNLKITEGTFQKGDNNFLNQVEWKPGSFTLQDNGKIIYIEIEDIKEPRLKEYDEARGFVITDYQKFLEDKWLEELRAKYPIDIRKDIVEELIRK